MPGNEDEAAVLLTAYLERANTRVRPAAVEDQAAPQSRSLPGAGWLAIRPIYFASGAEISRRSWPGSGQKLIFYPEAPKRPA